MIVHSCRGCGEALEHVFVDLGPQPLANSYVPGDDPWRAETVIPLRVMVCRQCLLVQLPELATAEAIFSDYAYRSSWSSSWVEHARRYAERAIERLALDDQSLVLELASNDGYLLQWFVQAGVPVLGVEPAANIAAHAEERGVPTRVAFFGADLGRDLAFDGKLADLVVANNVMAHVPDLHDFVGGIAAVLASDGRASLEFPHVLRLIDEVQYDTIYHEHFSYLSLLALEPVLERHGLAVVDVEELPTHGGSLRVWLAHARAGRDVGGGVERVRAAEAEAGLDRLETYLGFGALVAARKRAILTELVGHVEAGRSITAYGAPAKGNTLLNHCGVGPDMVAFTVDRNPLKQGTLLPGSRIPVRPPEALDEARPDLVLLLPWNLEAELTEQLAHVRTWGGRFLLLSPEPRVVP